MFLRFQLPQGFQRPARHSGLAEHGGDDFSRLGMPGLGQGQAKQSDTAILTVARHLNQPDQIIGEVTRHKFPNPHADLGIGFAVSLKKFYQPCARRTAAPDLAIAWAANKPWTLCRRYQTVFSPSAIKSSIARRDKTAPLCQPSYEVPAHFKIALIWDQSSLCSRSLISGSSVKSDWICFPTPSSSNTRFSIGSRAGRPIP